MACFIVPVTEAVVTTAATKLLQKKETQQEKHFTEEQKLSTENKIPFSQKMKWLNHMLWGGSAFLCFEHIWHGEVIFQFPFLTAASNPADLAEMLQEMGTVGVSMAAAVTLVWAAMVAVSNVIERRSDETPQPVQERGRQ